MIKDGGSGDSGCMYLKTCTNIISSPPPTPSLHSQGPTLCYIILQPPMTHWEFSLCSAMISSFWLVQCHVCYNPGFHTSGRSSEQHADIGKSYPICGFCSAVTNNRDMIGRHSAAASDKRQPGYIALHGAWYCTSQTINLWGFGFKEAPDFWGKGCGTEDI